MVKGENKLFDDSIFIDNEGNVIEQTEQIEQVDQKQIEIEEGEILLNAEGQVIDNEGKVIDKHVSTEASDNTENQEDPASTNSNKNSTLPPFAKSLKEAGILPDFELEEGQELTAETLVEAVREQIKKSEYSDLTEEQRDILEIMRSGGDVQEYLKYHQKEETVQKQFDVITDANAEEFTKKYYKLKGLSDEEITDIIDERVINGTLKERAENLKPSYNKILKEEKKKQVELSKQREAQIQKEIEQNLNNFKELINTTDELIKGHKLTQSVKDKVYDLGTKPVETKNGEPVTALQKAYQEDPLGTEFKLNYLYLITDGFTKMENLSSSKSSKSTALQELNERLEQERRMSGGMRSSASNNNNNKPSILDAKF